MSDLCREGIRTAVLSTATLREAAELLGPDSGYKFAKNGGNVTAADYAKRTGNVEALIELATYDPSITVLDVLKTSRRTYDPSAWEKAEDFLVERLLQGQSVADSIRRSGRVDTLIVLAEKGSMITPLDVLINGVKSSDPAEQKKARDYFRAKTKGTPAKAPVRATAAPAALIACAACRS
jgi:hypothetical protein